MRLLLARIQGNVQHQKDEYPVANNVVDEDGTCFHVCSICTTNQLQVRRCTAGASDKESSDCSTHHLCNNVPYSTPDRNHPGEEADKGDVGVEMCTTGHTRCHDE